MNKDVIYIEPEDDITDIILKIENSKEKIIALVPPKKAGVFRSVVNIKLIAKSAATSKKKVVLVTTDPSIKKLAAATKLPVTKNLQSAPAIPVVEDDGDESSSEELFEEPENEDTEEETDNSDDGRDGENVESEEKRDSKNKDFEDDLETKQDDEEDGEKPVSHQKSKKRDTQKVNSKPKVAGLVGWIENNKKLAVVLGVCGLMAILFLVWAFAIAPAVTVKVGIRTDLNNFSENVNFTTKLEDENLENNTFYLEAKKKESSQEVKFEATGKKNIGEKAKGEVIVGHYFSIIDGGGKMPINKGSTFTISGLSYVATENVVIMWDGDLKSLQKDCENFSSSNFNLQRRCLVSSKVLVEATSPGAKYNIEPVANGWSSSVVGLDEIRSSGSMSGGTDQEITVVTQADVDKAKEELVAVDQEKNKKELTESVSDGDMAIDSSFIQKTSDAVAVPAVGEEVKEGVTPTLKATTTATIYVLDRTKVEEFITKKANIGEAQKIYEMKNPFIESFLETEAGYTGKLKTSYAVGPRVTENSIIDIIKGKGLGEAQHDLRDINGIVEVTIDKSVPWVASIPGDPNKITIILDIKDQNGNKIETIRESEPASNEEKREDSSDEGSDGAAD